MFTIKEMIDNISDIDEMQLVKISDRLWKMGNLEEIKEKVSPNLFNLHIGINMIGNWKGEGWWGIICEHADLVSYIPETLDKFNLTELKIAFENVIKLFPEDTVFKSDNASYYDICNFLQSANLKVEDERLKDIPKDKRREIVKQVRQNVDRLENLTKPIWGDSVEDKGWKTVLDYSLNNLEE